MVRIHVPKFAINILEYLPTFLFRIKCVLIMVVQNAFLVNLVQHNEVMLQCFCVVCRPLRLQQIEDRAMNRQDLYDQLMNFLPDKCSTDLDKLFGDTIDLIVYGKVYKETCLRGTGYRYFKAWAKLQAQFADFPEKEFNTLCHKVNECCWVFENWEKIVANLTDQRMSEIDARRLTVPQLYQAKSIDWCLQLNDTLRRKGKRIDEPMYSPEKFDNIFQSII